VSRLFSHGSGRHAGTTVQKEHRDQVRRRQLLLARRITTGAVSDALYDTIRDAILTCAES